MSEVERAKRKFITENLDPRRETPYTLKMLSEDLGLSYGHLRNHSSKGKWTDELETERQRLQIETVHEIHAAERVNEIEIRGRQANFARLAMNKAILRIQDLDPKDLTAREAIELLRLGLTEERKALGLIDTVTYAVPQGSVTEGKHEAVKKAMALLDQLAQRRVRNVVSDQ